jgi:hypothetical protein
MEATAGLEPATRLPHTECVTKQQLDAKHSIQLSYVAKLLLVITTNRVPVIIRIFQEPERRPFGALLHFQ